MNIYGKGCSVDNLEYMRSFYIEFRISETPSRISDTPFKLRWSHYVQLLKITETQERKFYELECLTSDWSVRELKRQYQSSLYERLAFDLNSENVDQLSQKGQILDNPTDALKSPYVLEFLNLMKTAVVPKTI